MRLVLCALLLSGCHMLGPAAGGALSVWLTAAKDAEVAIHLSEESGCIVEAKDIATHEQVSELAYALCAALVLEKQGGAAL